VVDCSGYLPRQVERAIEALGTVGHYTFVSSVSAYASHANPGDDETAPLAEVAQPDDEDLDADYGGWKARSEATADRLLPGRVHHVRAGLLVGPWDDTDRFTWWVRRAMQGGVMLAPGPADLEVQFIDVRDVARWILRAIDQHITGPVNITGAAGALTMHDLLSTIVDVTESKAKLEWVNEDFLVDQQVQPWMELPLWIPPATPPTHAGFMQVDTSLAQGLGLELRPLTETIAATADDVRAQAESADGGEASGEKQHPVGRAGLRPEREAALLEAWSLRR